VTPEIAAGLNLPSAKGALVNQVTPDSPAGRAGVRERDLILRYGDREIVDISDLTRAVADTKAGTTRELRVLRDGRQQTLRVKIAALEPDEAEALADASSRSSADPASLSMSELGLGLAAGDGGLVVANVKVNSPAADAGLRSGDRVMRINQVEVKTVDAARKAVEDAKRQNRSAVLFQIERNDTRFFVGVPFSD
jgi:serine protease Do